MPKELQLAGLGLHLGQLHVCARARARARSICDNSRTNGKKRERTKLKVLQESRVSWFQYVWRGVESLINRAAAYMDNRFDSYVMSKEPLLKNTKKL